MVLKVPGLPDNLVITNSYGSAYIVNLNNVSAEGKFEEVARLSVGDD